jgi:hypothetical protein
VPIAVTYDRPVVRRILVLVLVAIFVVGALALASILVPRDVDESQEPTPVLTTTETIPAAEP